MEGQQEIIAQLEANIEQLLERYEFLQKENEILSNSNFQLQQSQKGLQDEITFYKEELQLLKVAKTLEGSEGYKTDTKAKIDFLVAEIDKCIHELNT
ncbi:small-conductance mechanosensitive channel [Wenyingzhuangia heitensis]|uniref:Small-conductance mechanosensitive channel n=1 Tax=Wenyingzhuangia heitensis TaxID=1487859 RepID=A0ABX0UD68_9FLAO|nr:efflux RND transporter permease subunit [Wenyingzhuangia heitensis]NIJ45416.1 small-conductance mechanosensitive channel [Wenyingzhuangia heitensis]